MPILTPHDRRLATRLIRRTGRESEKMTRSSRRETNASGMNLIYYQIDRCVDRERLGKGPP